ncbi:MAG: ATP-binding protein [Desulfuromonadales bacterium]|nr:ATP-binding protein [Desulfuromonadales bacterium]
MTSPTDFRLTWLWRHAFVNPHVDIAPQEQEYFRDRYLSMRDKVVILASRIVTDLPDFTVHDVNHIDALWETASIVAEGAIAMSPAEAFVFGAAVLLHDAALSVAAFPNGLADIKKTVAWKDTIARFSSEVPTDWVDEPAPEVLKRAIPEVLRRLHAEHSAELVEQSWSLSNGEPIFLIEDSELRYFYGRTIGLIAHSHWWPVSRIEVELSEDLGAFSTRTRSKIDVVKLACLLRVADAVHLDQRRAPRYLRSLVRPSGVAALHWNFQEKLATPHVELDSVVFTAGAPFTLKEADSWWLAYDTIAAVDRELREVDLLLQSRSRELLKARRVKGVGAPEQLARTIPTRGWRPVDTQLRVTDIPKIIESLGGAKLYGEDPTVPLRELIQNSADAIQARRRLQNRPGSWGTITISLTELDNEDWLVIEDNGVGMSEQVLTGPLIDFGTSFWQSSLAIEEFPGLLANGMKSIGHFGIGFFSIFMLGSRVRVTSRRYDRGEDTARVLEFRGGTATRPILYPACLGSSPLDGGTRVEILLKAKPSSKEGLLGPKLSLSEIVGSVAPNVETTIMVEEAGETKIVVSAGDWLKVEESVLISRLYPFRKDSLSESNQGLMRCLKDTSGRIYGRASIWPSQFHFEARGYLTVGGLRATRISNIEGVFLGTCLTAARDSALPLVTAEVLSTWASEQAELISASRRFSDEDKAACAEVILECGGAISKLPVALWGEEWLDEDSLRALLAGLDEITVKYGSEISYDENCDTVHPREFKDLFERHDEVLFVPNRSGSMLNINREKWPQIITSVDTSHCSNLAMFVWKIIVESFKPCSEMSIDGEVGTVNNVTINRDVNIYTRSDDDEFLEPLRPPKVNANQFYDFF